MVAETEERLRYLERKVAVERRFGVPSEVLVGEDLRRMAPYLGENVIGAEYCPGEGKIDPLQATHALARLAMAAGARYFTRSLLEAIRDDGGRFTLATSAGTLKARQIVNAAGAWSDSVARMACLASPVTGASIQVLVSEPMPHFIRHLIYHSGRHLTAKQSHGGQVIMGGAWPGDYRSDGNLFSLRARSIQGNLHAASSIVPRIAEAKLLRAWAAMNVIVDGAPIIGPSPLLPRFHQAVSGNGYTLAPILGRLTADLVLGRKPQFDPSPFSIARFS
jgi:glycine/D-amino acid oxidase-like deaminating enzyme